jgi:RNA polymerase primary sigma factor
MSSGTAEDRVPWAGMGGRDFLLDSYLRDLSSAADSAATTSRPQPGGNSTREELVVDNLRTVVQIAFHYRGMGLPLPDLINEGNIGLLRAAELFDPGRCVRFAHYAQPWIRVHMQRALSYQAWPVKYPADFNWSRSRVSRAEAELKADSSRVPDDTEVARVCGLAVPAVHRLRATPAPCFVPLDLATDDSGLSLSETIPDPQAAAPDREAERRSDRQYLCSLMKILSPLEEKVLRLRYGLDDGIPRTLQEVGRALGYVRQGVHRLETAALRHLKQHARFLQRMPLGRAA